MRLGKNTCYGFGNPNFEEAYVSIKIAIDWPHAKLLQDLCHSVDFFRDLCSFVACFMILKILWRFMFNHGQKLVWDLLGSLEVIPFKFLMCLTLVLIVSDWLLISLGFEISYCNKMVWLCSETSVSTERKELHTIEIQRLQGKDWLLKGDQVASLTFPFFLHVKSSLIRIMKLNLSSD